MKKTITLLALVLIAMFGFAQSFVMINVDNQQKTEELFNNDNLTIHYYNDNFVLATAKVVDESMQVLDNNAFESTDAYYIVYCGKDNQAVYIDATENANVLFKNDNIVIFDAAVKPFKNDGMTAVLNNEAKMPVVNRDFPVVTVENPTIREMMNQVNMDSLQATVQHLQDYQSRMWNSTNAFAASDWIAGRMEALCQYLDSPDARLDQDITHKAIEAFTQFVELYPESPYAEQAYQEMSELYDKLALKELKSAQLYYNLGSYLGNNYLSCEIVCKNALKNYPSNQYQEEFNWLILQSKYQQMVNSFEEKKMERARDTQDEYYNFTTEYPSSKHRKEADKMLVQIRKITKE